MRFLAAPTFVAATFILGVAADFEIYYEESLQATFRGDQNEQTAIRAFDGPPSCADVFNYASMPATADASGAGNARCDGDCPDSVDELELHGAGDWGHYTIYKGAGYKLTPADGGPLMGDCTYDKGKEYDCTDALGLYHGVRMFKCKSKLKGYHSR